MNNITNCITKLKEYNEVYNTLKNKNGAVMSVGLAPVHRALISSALFADLSKKILIITPDEVSSKKIASDMEFLTQKNVVILPYRDFVMVPAVTASHEFEQKRLSALYKIANGAQIVVASAQAISQLSVPRETLLSAIIEIKIGFEYNTRTLAENFVKAGYSRTLQVEGAGQFAMRGDIIDIYPPQEKSPIRIEFFGDEVDTMHYFDIGTQRRVSSIDNVLCLPCAEALPHMAEGSIEGLINSMKGIIKSRKKHHKDLHEHINNDIERLQNYDTLSVADCYFSLIYNKNSTALDYFDDDTIVVIDDTPRVRESVNLFCTRTEQDIEILLERGHLAPECAYFSQNFNQVIEKIKNKYVVCMDTFLASFSEMKQAGLVNFVANQMNSYNGNIDMATSDISLYLKDNKKIIMLCGSELRAKNMHSVFTDNDIECTISDKIPSKGKVHIAEGALSAGFEFPTIDLVVMTDGQIITRRVTSSSKKKKSGRDRVKSYTDLIPGDLVVHEHHGIGRFVGMERVAIDGAEKDFVKIAFAGTDFLYVPATNLDLISKYIGKAANGDNEKTTLSKLSGAEWTKARAKAKAATKELAEGLIKLYAERAKLEGFAFAEDDVWQYEFEQAFPYDETDDQLKCVEEIKADMQSHRPMDRLLCGDVGFGKTEVALRAVMKAVLSGKQAAILVPTTVLARQHYLTAMERFKGYPLNIELLSRYKTPAQQKKILEKLRMGLIDLIIGTHKLFRKDLQFHDLGLLVIDEEQRFGVSHKEKLKEISRNVDVLTLSATPIPRTLGMALSGVRDMSAIEEPPHNRHPVQTYVVEYSDIIVDDAIRRELSRGGQVYYLHNRVESIDMCAGRIQRAFPEHRVAVAHGKMSQKELATIMTDMSDGEIDILVCTTIIETGIDIPNANTLIVENADHMGLSQLHQLRGRVGRSSRHAFAYLTFKQGKVLSEISQKRLSAIREFAEFGSGFKIAMRDLEIRGAGNVLGPQQSGHMMSVGYDLYLKLLEEAVIEEQGGKIEKKSDCSVEINISANIPESYIEEAGQRIDLYRRIATIETVENYEDILDELIDRFGEPPIQCMAILDISLLRAMAVKQGITQIKNNDGRVVITWEKADFEKLSALCAHEKYKGRVLLNAGTPPYISIRLDKNEEALKIARDLVNIY